MTQVSPTNLEVAVILLLNTSIPLADISTPPSESVDTSTPYIDTSISEP